MTNDQKITDETFSEEIGICKQLSVENGGQCHWGKCADCGVIPLLVKLNQSRLIEDEKEVSEIKKSFGIIK